jgi:MFS family permease
MKRILPIIVISQLFCTSVWFAGNAALGGLMLKFALNEGFLAHAISAVQFGFISGTLLFAIFSISDRFSPSIVFFVCSIFAAFCNLGICMENNQVTSILIFRFLTGFFLAGIYPVGMKIAADHYQKGLGKSLGYLVGALVLGTAFPYFLNSYFINFPWQYIIYSTSGLSFIGGLLMLFLVPDGPFRLPNQKLKFDAFLTGFKNPAFKSAAFGYFGHMWELYAFWAFLPKIINGFFVKNRMPLQNHSILIFSIIASGGVACVISGKLSNTFGTKKTAILALSFSAICCLVSPFFIAQNSNTVLICFLTFWAMVVVADSPLFSTLVAQNAPTDSRGTSLTIINCIGFSITIVSIQCLNYLSNFINFNYLYMFLALGPFIGLVALVKNNGKY